MLSQFTVKPNFYIMKTAKIPVCGIIALYVYKIEYTLRCLEYICSVSSPLRRFVLSLRSRPYAS